MRRGGAIAVIGTIAAIAAACHRTIEIPSEAPPAVFLISIDTLRSDHLPAYGYARGSTPAIDALRRDSILFANAFSDVPQTLPSHTTIMTGLLPQNHGVRDNIGYVVSPRTPTVAAILRRNGWQTGAAVSAYVLRASTGIADGFDVYDDRLEQGKGRSSAPEERNGDLTRTSLEQWLRTANGRVFAFLHLYEPHAPYAPPPQFANAATPYDGEISYSDAIVGRFLDSLRRTGLYDRSLIILLSDHGEGLGEHGEDEHGVFVYRCALQVPLLVKLPHADRRGEVVTEPVALTDIAPTILEFAGVKRPAMDGSSLLGRHLDPSRAIYAETWYPRLHLGWSELESAIDAHSHYIRAPRSELYAWPSDRGELRNVVADERRVAASMAAFVAKMSKPLEPPSAVDPEDQKKLAALGYVGSTSGGGGPLPDPKDHIGELHEFKVALAQFARGDDAGCRRSLRALLASNPAFVDAYGLLAQTERRSGNDRAAVALLKTAMARFPGDPHVALALADALWATGAKRSARDHVRLAMRSEPVLAHEMLATFAYRDGKLADARAEIDAALSAAPDRIPSLVLAATIADRNGNYAREDAMLERVVDHCRATGADVPPGVRKQMGEVFLRLQRVPDAEAAFRAATIDDPADAEAWTKLAIVLAAEGRRADAEQTLRTLVARKPDAATRALAAEAAQAFGDAALGRELRAAR